MYNSIIKVYNLLSIKRRFAMKLGLVLEGGGSRSYFSAGVLDVLLEEKIIADYVIGTSAGIAVGVSYVSGQIGRNLSIAQNYLNDKRYMGLPHLLRPENRSFFNLKFVFEDIPNIHLPFDFKAFADFKGQVVGAVTNVNTGKAEYLDVSRNDTTFNVLRASCALPLVFPFITVDDQQYLDGGIIVPIPVDEAVRQRCDKTIVVMTRERGYRKQPEGTLKFAQRIYRKYPELVKALSERTEKYNANLNRVEELEAQGKAFVIYPENIDGIKRTESDPQKLTQLYNQGCSLTKESLSRLYSYLNKEMKI